VERIMQERATTAGLSFRCESGDGLPRVRADPRALKPDPAQPAVERREVHAEGGTGRAAQWPSDDDRGLRMVVYDTGIGIDPQDVPRAMAAFGQVDASWSRR